MRKRWFSDFLSDTAEVLIFLFLQRLHFSQFATLGRCDRR